MPLRVTAGGRGSPARGRPVAHHLGALCAALLLPTLALEAFLLVQLAGTERARHEAAARDAARRVAVALDRGLTTLQSVLQVLAASDHLGSGDLAAFHRNAAAIPRDRGLELVLRDREGRRLLDTGVPWGSAPRAGEADREADRAALETGGPRVSDLVVAGAPTRSPAFSIVAPARGPEGDRSFLLSVSVPADSVAEILRREGVPPGMTALVSDRRGTIVARSAGGEGFIGRPLRWETRAPTEGLEEGWVHAATDETGARVVLAFARSELAGWTAVVTLPEATFAAPLRRSLLAAAGLGALLAGLAAALAYVFAGRIGRPIRALAGLAAASGPGRAAAAALATPVREVNEVGHALAEAWDGALAREREREDLLLTLDRGQVLVRDLDGRITLWTAGKEHLFGWTREEAVGRLSRELLRTEFPRPLPEIEAELLARGEWQGELRQRRKDGALVIVACHWALRRARGGESATVVEACNDITALRRAEDELRRSRDLLASVLDCSADPILAKDSDGRLALLNSPAAALLGVTAERAVGQRIGDLLPPNMAAPLDAAEREVVTSGEVRRVEEEVPDLGGGSRILVSTKAPWRDAEGQVIGVVSVSRDISERRRAQARLREAEGELLHVSRLSDMGAMATALAHELNQPLTAVANFANAARRLLSSGTNADGERLNAAREAMEQAAEQAVHAGAIIRRLREFVGRGDGDKRAVDVNALVTEAASLALAGTRQGGVETRVSLAPGLPRVLADRVQIQQVVVNLVRNAVEAMAEATRRELEVTTSLTDGVEIRVADTGPGLAREVADRLFEPFVTTKHQGMGVGLSICRSIAEDHGGHLTTVPRPGGGTVFCLVLPPLPSQPEDGEPDDDG
jgi:two-component system sensor kinase FixL